MTDSSFHPSQRTLMGPGPSDVPPRILEAIGRPTLGHLDPEFVGLMDETKKASAIRLHDRKRAHHAHLSARLCGNGSCVCKLG